MLGTKLQKVSDDNKQILYQYIYADISLCYSYCAVVGTLQSKDMKPAHLDRIIQLIN